MKLGCSYCKKFIGKYPPRGNCQTCWNVFFEKNKMQLNAVRFAYENFGREVAIKVKGIKYVKAYENFREMQQHEESKG